jgi:hypothetical protein
MITIVQYNKGDLIEQLWQLKLSVLRNDMLPELWKLSEEILESVLIMSRGNTSKYYISDSYLFKIPVDITSSECYLITYDGTRFPYFPRKITIDAISI